MENFIKKRDDLLRDLNKNTEHTFLLSEIKKDIIYLKHGYQFNKLGDSYFSMIQIKFTPDNNYVQTRVTTGIDIEKVDKLELLQNINECNAQYNNVVVYYDDEDETITASEDLRLTTENIDFYLSICNLKMFTEEFLTTILTETETAIIELPPQPAF